MKELANKAGTTTGTTAEAALKTAMTVLESSYRTGYDGGWTYVLLAGQVAGAFGVNAPGKTGLFASKLYTGIHRNRGAGFWSADDHLKPESVALFLSCVLLGCRIAGVSPAGLTEACSATESLLG